jgi:ubiquinone/menaquinone biosynthesis C-methylase UbiE
MATPTQVRENVKEHYADFARTSASCCASPNTLYAEGALRDLPADIAGFTAGNGDPITPANLRPGETVLDLGSGGGLDCFLAARQVGESGRVIGVDMTPEMLARARRGAERLGAKNVEFREGYLESLPVEDDSVDVVISNCVINLSPDKPRVFREIFRVLKPGGRISVSDSVTNRPVPEELRRNRGEWCGCTSGALTYRQYVADLARAGFVDIVLTPNLQFARQALESGGVTIPRDATTPQLMEAVGGWEGCGTSVFLPHVISARKPA